MKLGGGEWIRGRDDYDQNTMYVLLKFSITNAKEEPVNMIGVEQ